MMSPVTPSAGVEVMTSKLNGSMMEMMDASSSDFVVTTTDDGREFQCSVAKIGGAREQRWVFIGTDRQLHIGPAWNGDVPAPQLRALVNEWWRTQKRREACSDDHPWYP
jgi:hypothetical protein